MVGEILSAYEMKGFSLFFEDGDYTGTVNTDQPLGIVLEGVESESTTGEGQTTIFWDVTNDAGQPVLNGSYYLKLEQKDHYGHTISMIEPINVVKFEQYVRVRIFNAAGEIVRVISRDGEIRTDKMNLKVPDVIAIQQLETNQKIQYGQSDEYVVWDGLNARGELVTSGTYEIEVVIKNFYGEQIKASKTVLVLVENSEYLSGLKAVPNPASAGSGLMAFGWDIEVPGKMKITIFNMQGELVRVIYADSLDKRAEWDFKSVSGSTAAQGVYFAVFENLCFDGTRQRETLKFAVK